MSKIALTPNASGSGTFTIASPNSDTDRTLTLPDEAGTVLTSVSSVVANSGPTFKAYRQGTQTISSNTTTTVQLNNEEYDTDGCFDTSTYRFTPTVAGYYHTHLVVFWLAPTNNQIALACSIRHSGSTDVGSTRFDVNMGSTTDSLQLNASTIVYMNGTTDYLDYRCYQYLYSGSGATINIAGNGPTVTYAEAYLVRTA